MKKVLFVFLVFFSLISVSALVDTDGDSYLEIHDCVELQSMNQNLAANYELANDIDCSMTRTWNFLNNGEGITFYGGFEPIAFNNGWHAYNVYFEGNFNGHNYNISNLYINRTRSIPSPPASVYQGSYDVGLFGNVRGVNISNIHLVNISISGKYNVGGVVGYINREGRTNIANSSVSGYVSGYRFVGGIVGYAPIISNIGLNIERSFFQGQVVGSYNIGGILGEGDGNVIINNSYSSGYISGVGRVGGITGNLYNPVSSEYWSYLENTYSSAVLSSDGSGVYGLVSLFDSRALNSFYDNEISGNVYFYPSSMGLGITPLSTDQMKNTSTFIDAGWDSNIWIFKDGEYPELCFKDNCEDPDMHVYLDPKYIRDTQKYRKYVPDAITPFDDIICELKIATSDYQKVTDLDSPALTYPGKLMTGDDFNLEIVSGNFKYVGVENDNYVYQMGVNGWDYDGSNEMLGNPVGWSEDETVLNEIFETEKLQCEIKINEKEFNVDNTEASKFSQKLTSCPTFLSLGEGFSNFVNPYYVSGEFNVIRNNINKMVSLCLSKKAEISCSFEKSNNIKNPYLDVLEESWYSYIEKEKIREAIFSAASEFGIDARLIAAIGLVERSQQTGDFLLVDEYVQKKPSWYTVAGIKYRWEAKARKYRYSLQMKGGNKLPEKEFGRIKDIFVDQVLSIINDDFSNSPELLVGNSNLDLINNNLKTHPAFNRIKGESRSNLLNTGEGVIRAIAASLKAIGLLWENDIKSGGSIISNRPEILATIYNMGFLNKTGGAAFIPKPNPMSGGTSYSVVVDGVYYQNINFGEKVKLFYNSERMRKFIAGEKAVKCTISTSGGNN